MTRDETPPRQMINGSEEQTPSHALQVEPWLLASADSLSERSRRWLIAICSVLVVGWSAIRNGRLLVAWGLPDVRFYMDMAEGHTSWVPQPFSSRPLAPLLARALSPLTQGSLQGGFTVLAYGSLTWAVLVVFWLAWRSSAPRWVPLAVITVPFWPQLLGFAGLPDPLYTALLATLLLLLELRWVSLAAAMMLPLMLARESTYLVLVCLLATCWRQLRPKGAVLAIGSAALGAAVVHRLSAASLPNPEHLSGRVYLLGKVVSNSLRSVGVEPWSNVYPYLCSTPAWQTRLNLGGVHSVGVCSWNHVPPAQSMWAILTIFGVLPVLLLAQRRRWIPAFRHGSPLLRFCLLYGGLSLLAAPGLGTWYVRLFGYGWPLPLVALPRLLGKDWRIADPGSARSRVLCCAALLLAQVAVCAVGQGYGTPAEWRAAVALQAAAIALLLGQRLILRRHGSPA